MKVIVDNLMTEYEDEGAGKVVLFLHGWRDSLHSFDNLARILCRDFRVIRMDLPGFGGTEINKETWNLDAYIIFVNNFIKKLNLNVFAIAGHSFGGRITLKAEAKGIFKAQKIILIASAGIAKRKTLRNYIFAVLSKLGKIITYIPPLIFWQSYFRKQLYNSIGADYYNAGKLKDTFLNVIKEDLTEHARNIKIPALLIWGDKDMETPLSDGERLSKVISGSKLEVLNGYTHFVHKERPEEVAKLIQKFLQ